MGINKSSFTFTSVTGLADIFVTHWRPQEESNIKGTVQIAHGMAEHIERYDGFASYLAENGYAVFGNDHIGHGKSVNDENEKGFFGHDNFGGAAFVEDCKKLHDIITDKYKNTPSFFFGHSMGSFIARRFSAKYGEELKGVVYCGTSGANPAAGIAVKLAQLMTKFNGDHFKSSLIDNLAFGPYSKKFEKRTTFDWLTRDNQIVDKYIKDPNCGFLFTTVGYGDLFSLLAESNKKEWFASVPQKLPILIISGAMDPVGNYGKGIAQVVKNLKDTDHKITEKLYADSRHEILNELNKEDVYKDVLGWFNSIVEK
ncbi:MAG: alpha/beta hydrolase [Oscillospiraceae bacterium]|jgi:alpha-beta hydrolase superfamily lysophospholipase|nr:alpha/beta hydrolase [Oscillospiraceae bacterium]